MKKKSAFKRCLRSRQFTFVILLLLIVMGPIMIAVDLTFTQEWIGELQMVDFYIYLGFMGFVTLWSMYGFLTALVRSSRGFTVYMIGLFIIIILQFIVGTVHILLLFMTYQPILMNNCLQRHPSRLFWWSLGFEDTEETIEILKGCQAIWRNIAIEQMVSWIVYSIISFICLYFVVRYQRLLLYQNKQAESGEWSDEDNEEITEKRKGRISSITYHDVEFPSSDDGTKDGLSASMYQQRQRLFDEIAKRKRARKNLNRKSIAGDPNRTSVMVFHPLDLSQDSESYQPPSMPPSEQGDDQESWNRYNKVVSRLQEDEEAIERQKRLNALSAERMEYEKYRSEEQSTSAPQKKDEQSNEDDDYDTASETSSTGGTSHRRRPKSGRWSAVYADNNPLKPLTQLEEDEEDDENQKLMNPS